MAGAGVQAWLSSLVLLALFAAMRAEDTVTADRPLSGDAKLVSRGGKFALGFFQPDGGAAGNWYVGIWYHNISVRTPVWVANRERPVSDPAASRLVIAPDDSLVLLDPSGSLAWSTNSGYAVASTTAAVLHDTGNLVLAPASNASVVLWQSFDDIGDTWLPGGKLGWDRATGVSQRMNSWRARGDPAPGPYTLALQLDPPGEPQLMMLWEGASLEYWTSSAGDLTGFNFLFADDDRESYVTYSLADNSTVYRFVADVSGQLKGWLWVEALQEWNLVYEGPKGWCGTVPHGCGAFGVCSEPAFACACATGFVPWDAARWRLGDYTGGCVRNAELQCRKNSSRNRDAKADGFVPMDHMRLPDYGRVAGATSAGDCQRECLRECTCSAYEFNETCIFWDNELQDLVDGYGYTRTLYLRLAASELPGVRSHKRRTVAITLGALAIICFVVIVAVVLIVRSTVARKVQDFATSEGFVTCFKYRDLQSFTKNFSDKLGRGAFGSVFRGQLPGVHTTTTTTIAVKKLEGLRQGEKQFRAEVSTLGTVHHVNLIRLLGFCSEGGSRKLLVYEYMPNGSLDRHLFGATTTLSWRARYNVAVGVAKGLAYLHDMCRDCIIHCDVKPENILLDAEFAPKVADFGLAKLLGRDFSRVLTTVRGTIGYLAPEWISGDPVTAKADVFSYGMMLFEIVSGRRNVEHGKMDSNSSSSGAETTFFPVAAARRLAEGEAGVEALLDPALGGDASAEEVLRVCKVACWCIQDEVDARPTMAEVVQVLEGVMDVEMPPVPRYLEMLAGRRWA